jgi:hypothetical protein
MKTFMMAAGFALFLSSCANTGSETAWGKPGVSKRDYGTDVGMCTGFAVRLDGGNGANTAGGIDGKTISNTNGPAPDLTPAASVNPDGTQTSHVAAPLPASGSYSGMASSDFAQRAATQQRTAEMAAQRARSEALKSCLVGRGYQQFALTEEQAGHLASLKKGTNEYHEYLYKLGSDAEVVGKQSKLPAK